MWFRRLLCKLFGHSFSLNNTIVHRRGFLRACSRCDYDHYYVPFSAREDL